MAGSGDLEFLDSSIIMAAPRLSGLFNNDFLASLATTNNLIFSGLGPTTALVNGHGLQHQVYVRHVAEEGILRAQFSAYFAWLQGVSLIAIVVALMLSALIGALITAVIKARRDFPLRLAGKRWSEIVSARVVTECSVGAALVAAVLLVRGGSAAGLVVATAVLALLVSPATHLVATRWSFKSTTLRKL